MRFQGKVAVITGAGDGIARAVARILAGEGAYTVAVDVREDALAALAEELEAAGGKVTTITTDVMDSQQVQRMVETAMERCGKIDILVNAVGGSMIIPNNTADADELTIEDWDKVLNYNLRGTFLCSNAVIKRMKEQGGGKIINISSIAGHAASNTSSSAYAAAKGGIMAFTKKVAREMGPFGISCNAIAPGRTLSNRVKSRWDETSEEERRRDLDAIPLGRLAQPEDQAKVIAFLASEDADFVNGVTIDVNGGQY